ncbi:Ig-like domain-containing protein, partial [Candidatus Poriferisodalis sp.]|uniref:Ig-like domain-containing protein n=1 Tax=Candidatus Poriferisodalis sp. TaxID=3101277 RepID=UPI003B0112F5
MSPTAGVLRGRRADADTPLGALAPFAAGFGAAGDVVVEHTAGPAGGTVLFAYEVCDSLGACESAQVTIMASTADCTITGTEGDDTIRGTVGVDKPRRPGRTARDTPATPAAQRVALMAFYSATGGSNWTRNANWGTAAPVRDRSGVTTNTDDNITRLYLHTNQLTGAISAEIADLANLTTLYLSSNRLTGLPAEIGSLTNLAWLWLDGNRLSGCVPASLSAVPNVRLDAGVSFCEPARVSVTDASVTEGDGEAVFTVTVQPGTDTADTSVSLPWSTVSGTAAAGSDYQGSSGTLQIPAGARFATIAVPVTDDNTPESTETFSINLTVSAGATLADTTATATIIDDDGTVPGLSRVAPCEGAVLTGSVAGVFDFAQSGYGGDSHVFVDVDVTCAASSEAVGLPVGVEVTSGPASSLGASGHCITRAGIQQVTRSTGTGQGCVADSVARPITGDVAGRSTHLVRIPDASIGQMHQLLAWIDADRDGTHGRGEPFVDFESDFESRVLGADGETAFGMPQRFEVSLVTPWSDRVSRAGHYTSLRLALRTQTDEVIGHTFGGPIYRRDPVAETPVGVSMLAGPSRTAAVMCSVPPTDVVPSPGYSRICVTDARGHVDVRFLVPPGAVSVLRQQHDLLRVWLDTDQDSSYDFETVDENQRIVTPEPASTLRVPLAKAVNYVALGDSYSAGESGRDDAPGFTGSYLTDNPAGESCRRWSLAYPVVLKNEFLGDTTLGIDVTFDTFACTGAETAHIYHPLDPDNDSTLPDLADSRRPSAADESFLEPRQAVSLANVQAMSDVDMITITIGGNDAGFGDVIAGCVSLESAAGCGPSDLVSDLESVRTSLEAVFQQVKLVAPNASVYVLGYPYLTPVLNECTDATPEVIGDYESTRNTSFLEKAGLSRHCVEVIVDYVTLIEGDACEAFRANQNYHAVSGWWAFPADLAAFLFSDSLNLEASEAVFLRNTADELNSMIRRAAETAGVHYVDAAGAVSSSGEPARWERHSPCTSEPWLRGYVPDEESSIGTSDGSFHPTAAGHRTYAAVLEQFIRDAVRRPSVMLNGAGLPSNPSPQSGSSRGSSSPALRGSSIGVPSAGATGTKALTGEGVAEEGLPEARSTSPMDSSGPLLVRRAAVGSGCGAEFISAGEQVTLSGSGFAAGASVAFSTAGISLGDATVSAASVAAATADADGDIEAVWTMPTPPAASDDPAPRAYAARATGVDSDGGTHTLLMTEPLVAYPGTAPCAAADTATTTRGTAVQVAVLANDTDSTGGALDPGSVAVRPVDGGRFSVDTATGAVTFTPDAGFWGTVETSYVVYDGWGFGGRADLTITVNGGCTVTGTDGVPLIEGTAGDDVLCVPDREDWRAFHIIDGKGGDDVILGGAGVEWVYGGAGADTIYSGGGNDRIVAGTGIDTIHGGPGMDSVYSLDTADAVVDDDYEMILSPSTVVAQSVPEPEDDWVWVDVSQTVEVDVLANDHDPNENIDPATLSVTTAPSDGAAFVTEDADGRAVVSYSATALGGTVSFSYVVCDSLGNCAAAEVTVMVGTADCTIVGTSGDDIIRGTPGDDVICGLDGDDDLRGIGGNDIVIGGNGDDDVNAGDGNDTVWGGPGADTLDGGPGDDAIWGAAGDDTLLANSGTDRLNGGPGADTVTGGGGDDLIWGGLGDDTLDGHAGGDTIWGGPGADTLRGGNGNDTIWGNADNDRLTGGAGADSL